MPRPIEKLCSTMLRMLTLWVANAQDGFCDSNHDDPQNDSSSHPAAGAFRFRLGFQHDGARSSAIKTQTPGPQGIVWKNRGREAGRSVYLNQLTGPRSPSHDLWRHHRVA